MNDNNNDLMNFDDAVEYSKLGKYTLSRLVREGQIPITRITRKVRLVKKTDIDAYLASKYVRRKLKVGGEQ